MTDHAHTIDDRRACTECPPSRVKPADVRTALEALGADTGSVPQGLADADLIPLLGRLTEHVARIVKHRVDPADLDECAAFISGSDQTWAVQLAHSLLPAAITAAGRFAEVGTQAPVDAYVANVLGFAHMAVGACAEVARVHIGHDRHPEAELYRQLRSLHEGLGAMVEHRLLTPPATPEGSDAGGGVM